jgi:hypothetical protein
LRQQVEVIEPAHGHAAAMIALRLVLECRPLAFGRHIALRLEVDLEHMAVRVAELVGGTMAQVAVAPADAGADRLDGLDAPLQRLGASGAIANVAHAGGVRRGELEGVDS